MSLAGKDINTYGVCFSLIACMGLVENSSVVLVASMLISPLMVSHVILKKI